MATWTGPWRVVRAHHPHLFEIQNIVSGRVHTAHVARLRFNADSQLNVTADVKNVFQHAFNQGLFQMAGIVRVAEADDHSLIVLVDWVGFEIDERTWEPFKGIFEAAPELLLASRANLVFNCDVLNFLAFSLYQACCSNLFVQRALGVL